MRRPFRPQPSWRYGHDAASGWRSATEKAAFPALSATKSAGQAARNQVQLQSTAIYARAGAVSMLCDTVVLRLAGVPGGAFGRWNANGKGEGISVFLDKDFAVGVHADFSGWWNSCRIANAWVIAQITCCSECTILPYRSLLVP